MIRTNFRTNFPAIFFYFFSRAWKRVGLSRKIFFVCVLTPRIPSHHHHAPRTTARQQWNKHWPTTAEERKRWETPQFFCRHYYLITTTKSSSCITLIHHNSSLTIQSRPSHEELVGLFLLWSAENPSTFTWIY